MSESVSEFFDAQEVLLSASSSENEVRLLGVLTSTARDHEFELKKRKVVEVCGGCGCQFIS